MQDHKNKIEAILFTTGRFLTLDEIGRFAGIGSIGFIKQVLGELSDSYSKRETALEIINDEKSRWKLNIRKEYLHITEKLLSDAELDKPTQETLAIIAYRQPAIQSDVVSYRGNKAYEHIKQLREEGFIISERFGRTKLLKLSPKFFDYFDVVEDELKGKLTNQIGGDNTD
jgi:segregation and condensation protein B